jgi:hypothetical protein
VSTSFHVNDSAFSYPSNSGLAWLGKTILMEGQYSLFANFGDA